MDGDGTALTDEQNLVLQAIYDRFRERGEWPTFLSIDRPLRREHGMDTRAVFNSMPDLFVFKSRQAMGPTDTDQLTLRLPGIAACTGGREDTERFARMLRWFAEQEVAFAPPADSEDTMPRITSDNVAAFPGLRRDQPGDEAALWRLYGMLRLDLWGTGSNGSNEEGWGVDLTPDIWRFRDVQTVEDVVRVREQWITEAQAAAPHFRAVPQVTWSGDIIVASGGQGSVQPGQSVSVAYVSQQVIDDIQAKAGSRRCSTTSRPG